MPVIRPPRRPRSRIKRYRIVIWKRDHQPINHATLVARKRQLRAHVTSDPSCTEFDVWIVCLGGSAKQAYLIVTLLRAYCRWLQVVVLTHANSAATLIAIAGDVIYMGPASCLSPLDAQWQRAEQGDLVCGLDAAKSLDVLGGHARKYLLRTKKALEKRIDFTADELLRYAADLFGRVVDESDPLWMARVERELELPVRYLVELLEARACQVPPGFNAQEVANKFVYGFECHDQAIRHHHATALGLPPSITDSWGRKWAVGFDECDVAALPGHVLAKLLARFGRQVLVRQSEEEMIHSMIHSKRHSNAVYHTVSHLPEKPAPAVSHLPQPSADLSLPKTPAHVMPTPGQATRSPLPLKIRQAIECSLPGAPGYRNRLLLQFARYLKAIPALANCQAEELEPYVRQWYERALPNIGTADFGETWSDFAIAWDRVQFPVGQGPLDEIYRAGLEQMPESASRYRHRKMRELVALCQALQRRSDPYPFWLACRPTASVLGISPPTANRWLNKLRFDGVLELVTEGSRGRAAEYYYRGGSSG